MPGWSIPPAHRGQTVAVLASGPSMSQAVADKLRDAAIPCVAVNTTHRLAPWAWCLYAADPEWWQHDSNRDALKFPGLRVSCSPVPGVHVLRHAGIVGYSDDPGCVHTYGNSGAQAIQIAAKSGAKRIILCGFEMSNRAGRHWHGDHPHGLRNTSDELYATFIKRYESLAAELALRQIEVLNCTPGSALTCFRTAHIDDAILAADHERRCAWAGL